MRYKASLLKINSIDNPSGKIYTYDVVKNAIAEKDVIYITSGSNNALSIGFLDISTIIGKVDTIDAIDDILECTFTLFSNDKLYEGISYAASIRSLVTIDDITISYMKLIAIELTLNIEPNNFRCIQLIN